MKHLLKILILNLMLIINNTYACSVDNSFSTSFQPATLQFTPNGKFAYVLSSGNNTITTYSYNIAQGKLDKILDSKFESIYTTPTFGGGIDEKSNFIYVTFKDSNNMAVFSINQMDGSLTKVQHVQFSESEIYPYSLTFSPDNLYAYISFPLSNLLEAFKVDQNNGNLLYLNTYYTHNNIPNKDGLFPFLLTFSPDRKYAYLANRDSNTLLKYLYSADSGSLTLELNETIPNLYGDYVIQFDKSGKYAYIPLMNSNKIMQYSNFDNLLMPLESSSIASGNQPNTLFLFSSENKFAFMGNFDSSSISIYGLKSNGELNIIDLNYKTLNQPIILRQPPDQGHIFVVSKTEGCIADYTIESDGLSPRYVNTESGVNKTKVFAI